MLCHGLYISVMLLAQTNCSFVCLLFHICPLNLSSHHISPVRESDVSVIIIHYDKTFMIAKPTKMEINEVSQLLVLLCIRVSDKQRTGGLKNALCPSSQSHNDTLKRQRSLLSSAPASWREAESRDCVCRRWEELQRPSPSSHDHDGTKVS